jgi:3-phenylpropionate/trans-cinnamate dioxygenase ferredoxin reductase subunit
MERTASYVEPESWYAENNIVLRLGTRVTGIDRQGHKVNIDGAEPVSYDRLLLAPGARIRKLDIPGADASNVHYIRTFQHADAIRQAAKQGARAVIIGGSFIGTETAASLRSKEVEVDVLNMDPNLYGRILGKEVGDAVEEVLSNRGALIHNNVKVTAFETENGVAKAVIDSEGKRWEGDFFVIGAGVLPNDSIAKDAGLPVDNGILVNELLQTADPDVFAAGDAARWKSTLYPEGIRVEHWDVAYNTGETAGKNMAGESNAFDGMPFVFSDIGDRTLDVIGFTKDYDRVIWRPIGFEQFGAAYIKDNKVVQGATIGDEDYVNGLGDLIRSGKDVREIESQLADPSVKVQDLA